MTDIKAVRCDHCGKIEPAISLTPGGSRPGWIYVRGMPLGRLDFCCPAHLMEWCKTPPFGEPANRTQILENAGLARDEDD